MGFTVTVGIRETHIVYGHIFCGPFALEMVLCLHGDTARNDHDFVRNVMNVYCLFQ